MSTLSASCLISSDCSLSIVEPLAIGIDLGVQMIIRTLISTRAGQTFGGVMIEANASLLDLTS